MTENERDRSELAELRTRVANEAASLAEAVNDGFDGFHMGAGDYVVELMTPDGPSTGGGVQARQHLRLVPRRKGYSVVVAGSVDPVSKAGELRTYQHVSLLHLQRFGKALDIMEEEYDAFLTKAAIVMNLARVKASRLDAPADLVAWSRSRRRMSLPALGLFLVVTLLAGVVLYRVALTLR